jgi:uncharacterized membrane protein
MIGVAILVVVVAVAAGVGISLQQRSRASTGPQAGAAPEETAGAQPVRPAGTGGLVGDLSRWVRAGLISTEQAEAIAGFEAVRRGPVPERRVSLLAEALGYVGAVLALAGAAVGLGQSWDDLPTWVHVVIPAGATVLLVLGGFLLRRQQEPAFGRLMSVLWVLSVGGAAWALAVVGSEVLDAGEEHTALLAAGGCAVLAGVLYLARRRGLQQAALLASLYAVAVSGLVSLPYEPAVPWDDTPPLWWFAAAVWALSVAWVALGWREKVRPGALAVAMGCLGALVGPAIGLADYEWLLVPGLLTAAGMVAVSVPTRQTPLLALGMLGAFGYITWAVVRYFRHSLGVPVALVIVGAVFLALAVAAGFLATRNRRRTPASVG